MKWLSSSFASVGLLVFVAAMCGCAHVPNGNGPEAMMPAVSEKVALRNNAASLLYKLLNDEKNVSKILIIKHDRKELHQLIKAIATTTGDAAERMTEMARTDPTLNLQSLELPPGEKAARDAIAKTKEHELLFSSGKEFEFKLLLSQAQAMSYGSHLAKVTAENSDLPDEKKAFLSLEVALNDLYQQVVTLMRNPPAQ